ncbi:MAG: diheme cytochrome c [Rhizobacter sp.]|jgi:cytochrome c553|nr:diheme cytochrome c [Rhizobacter sp.]MBP6269632.1 diheme cytochrome c [Rhizobacter sp.]
MSLAFRFDPRRALLLAMVGLAGLPAARAEEGARLAQAPALPKYQQECAACHVAYPPGLLPAASWQRLMSNLPRHFGTDASLDAATEKEISTWLTQNAATRKRMATPPPEDRITRAAWFVRQHDEVPAETWKRASIKSAANCSACHSRADQGDFDEDNVRIPR